MRFTKYHALGNDYLVLESGPDVPAGPLDPVWVERVCHRHFGLGSDGILYGPLAASGEAAARLQIYNPDGSEAEKSGNGLRIFARHLLDTGKASGSFTVETPGGTVTCEALPDGRITVEMGTVSFQSADIPVTGPAREVVEEEIEIEDQKLVFCAATIGNPHCVLPFPEVTEEIARTLGPKLETHPHFPNRTNVQFLQVLDRANIRIEIWERGAGYTLASGSSSSAAAAVARKLGAVDEAVTVHMPGGILDIQIDESYAVRMTGPVTKVGVMNLDPDVFSYTSTEK